MAVVIAAPSGEPHEVTLAWQRLQDHQTNPDTGECRICQLPGPCAVANEAAALLVERGVSVVEEQPSRTEGQAARLTVVAKFRRRGKQGYGPS